MHLGTPFGAFLDPVADKVSFSFCCSDTYSQCCIRSYLQTVSFQSVSYSRELTSSLLFSTAAYGSCDTSVAVHQTFGNFTAHEWTMASDSSFHCHHWERGSYPAKSTSSFPKNVFRFESKELQFKITTSYFWCMNTSHGK